MEILSPKFILFIWVNSGLIGYILSSAFFLYECNKHDSLMRHRQDVEEFTQILLYVLLGPISIPMSIYLFTNGDFADAVKQLRDDFKYKKHVNYKF